MLIDDRLLDELMKEAAESPRLRKNRDMRNSAMWLVWAKRIVFYSLCSCFLEHKFSWINYKFNYYYLVKIQVVMELKFEKLWISSVNSLKSNVEGYGLKNSPLISCWYEGCFFNIFWELKDLKFHWNCEFFHIIIFMILPKYSDNW